MAEPLTPKRIAELRVNVGNLGDNRRAVLKPKTVIALLDAAEQAVAMRAENERLRTFVADVADTPFDPVAPAARKLLAALAEGGAACPCHQPREETTTCQPTKEPT